jgi:hypothetical protein
VDWYGALAILSALLEIPIFTGDVYIINGKYTRAVVGGTEEILWTILANMFGHLDDDTIIYWS